MKWSNLSEQHRKWLRFVPFKSLSGGERQVVMNTLRQGGYNEPTRVVLNRIRKLIYKI